jgi:putative hydrolase of the HAD superfamily
LTTAFIFDLDDTLYPERQYNLSGLRVVAELVQQREGKSGAYAICVGLYETGDRSRILDELVRRLELRTPVVELVQAYRDHQPHLTLFNDASKALDLLGGRNPLGLITDGYAHVQRLKVQGLGIADRFLSTVFSDDYGRRAWKPSLVPYQETMRRLNGLADHFVYVGDNPAKDFISARALGWYTVQVRRPENIHPLPAPSADHEANLTVSSLADVPWQSLERCP